MTSISTTTAKNDDWFQYNPASLQTIRFVTKVKTTRKLYKLTRGFRLVYKFSTVSE